MQESEAAREFAAKLRDALALEAEVQAYEQATLGLEDPETLAGYRLQRRLRLDRDKAANEAGRAFAIQALVPPRPADLARAELGRRELALLTNLGRAYETSRADPIVDHYAAANSSFLQSADWAMRDRAVVLRDQLVERETAFTQLLAQAEEMLAGTVDAAQTAAMEDLLAEVAPETREVAPDLSVLVMQDADLRMKVLAELRASLQQQTALPTAPPPAVELLPRVTHMQSELVTRAGIAPVIQEHMQVEAELELVEADVVANADSDDLDLRRELIQKKMDLTRRHNELSSQWFGTEPDPELYARLIEDQDALIRRMMLDLGPRGALFGARYDTLRELAAEETDSSMQRWSLLQEQQDLIGALTAAKPEPDPLDGMLPLATLVKARPPPPPETLAAAGKPGSKPRASPAKAAPKPKKGPPKAKGKPKGKKPGGAGPR